MVFSLWTRNREGSAEGVYSHQTAFSLHGLAELDPTQLHLTVPVTYRRSSVKPRMVILHPGGLETREVEPRQGFAVTRLLRTLADLSAEGALPRGGDSARLVAGNL